MGKRRRRKVTGWADARMRARFVQLLARLLGVVLTAAASKLHLEAGETEAIAVAAVALGAFVFDLYSHQKQTQQKRRHA